MDLLQGNNIVNIVTPKRNIFSILSPQEKYILKYFPICAIMNVLVMKIYKPQAILHIVLFIRVDYGHVVRDFESEAKTR